jgi:hypothetical protein
MSGLCVRPDPGRREDGKTGRNCQNGCPKRNKDSILASVQSTLVQLVTGYVSPQLHVVYDPFFMTVPNEGDPELIDVICINRNNLLDTRTGWGHIEFNQIEEIDELGHKESLRDNLDDNLDDGSDDNLDHHQFGLGHASQDDEDWVPDMARANEDSDPDNADPSMPILLRQSHRKERKKDPNAYGGKGGAGVVKAPNYNKRKIRQGDVNNTFRNSFDWSTAVKGMTTSWLADYDRFTAQVESNFDELHPLGLTLKANALRTPNWNQAMSGLESNGYWKAMELEIQTLLGKNGWVIVLDREDHMNVLPST